MTSEKFILEPYRSRCVLELLNAQWLMWLFSYHMNYSWAMWKGKDYWLMVSVSLLIFVIAVKWRSSFYVQFSDSFLHLSLQGWSYILPLAEIKNAEISLRQDSLVVFSTLDKRIKIPLHPGSDLVREDLLQSFKEHGISIKTTGRASYYETTGVAPKRSPKQLEV